MCALSAARCFPRRRRKDIPLLDESERGWSARGNQVEPPATRRQMRRRRQESRSSTARRAASRAVSAGPIRAVAAQRDFSPVCVDFKTENAQPGMMCPRRLLSAQSVSASSLGRLCPVATYLPPTDIESPPTAAGVPQPTCTPRGSARGPGRVGRDPPAKVKGVGRTKGICVRDREIKFQKPESESAGVLGIVVLEAQQRASGAPPSRQGRAGERGRRSAAHVENRLHDARSRELRCGSAGLVF